jgi:micrococcal nuclease
MARIRKDRGSRIARPLLAVAIIASGCSASTIDLSRQAPATLASEPGGFQRAEVTRIVDGDTIEVRLLAIREGPGAGEAALGEVHDVRLIGIDTPESVDPRSPVECFGKESSAATAALLEGRRVVLVKDVEETDGFDRLLRYVYLGAEMVNARLVLNGYATAYTYPPNVRHSALFVDLERRARRSGAGLWSDDTCAGQA